MNFPLNYLLFAGFIIFTLRSITNDKYEFTWKTPQGLSNLGKSGVSFLIVIVAYACSMRITYDDNIDTSNYQGVIKYITVCFIYFFTGVFIDRLFVLGMNYFEKKAESKLGTTTTITDIHKEENTELK